MTIQRDMSKWIDKTKPAPWFTAMTVEERQQYGREKFMAMCETRAVRDFVNANDLRRVNPNKG
jgi:hypothetical protein